MRVTVLGCGSSGGVPMLGPDGWGECDPADPRNRRTRVSILVEANGGNVLVDTSPDLRQQLLAAQVAHLDGVLYTHGHADHVHGIDDLRSLNFVMRRPIDVYADPTTRAELEQRFAYVFRDDLPGTTFAPRLVAHDITGPLTVGGIDVVPFEQDHGPGGTTLGFRFGPVAYSTDVKTMPEAAFDTLQGIDTWIVDCVGENPHVTHSHVAQTLDWIARVEPRQAFLTHMSHRLDYAKLAAKLPPGVAPAHDGLIIDVPG